MIGYTNAHSSIDRLQSASLRCLGTVASNDDLKSCHHLLGKVASNDDLKSCHHLLGKVASNDDLKSCHHLLGT